MTGDEMEAEDHDASVQAYMDRLLKDSRHRSGDAQPNVPERRPNVTGRPTQPAAATPSPQPPQESATEAARREWVPKKPPSQLIKELPAMRELANLSAQTALKEYASVRKRNRLYSTAMVTVASLVCAVVALSYSPGNPPLYYAGMASLLVSVIWGAQFGVFLRIVRIERRHRKQLASEASHEDSSLDAVKHEGYANDSSTEEDGPEAQVSPADRDDIDDDDDNDDDSAVC
jgi:hypothetical protein